MAQLVYYSIAWRDSDPRPDLIWQFDASLRTLRARSPQIPVALFVHGPLPYALAAICHANDVMVHHQGPYEQGLATRSPAGWEALASYPLLHKFLNFEALAATGATQVLYCDCDTLFREDVAVLLGRYQAAELYAREEVHSSRSHYGADREFIDEPLLSELAASESVAAVAPFNLGVVLFNHGVCARLAALERLIVDYAWRFAIWMALHPATGGAATYGEFAGAAAAARAAPEELARALPYPSVNRWILDEVALWLALGHASGLRCGDFAREDVAQNGEFEAAEPELSRWILCHYYSQNLARVRAWSRRQHGF